VGGPGIVVVVDGPSSVGKTLTVAGLQAGWPRVRPGPLVDAGLDRALSALGGAALPRWWELIQRYEPVGGPPERVVWGPMGRELVAGMHRAAAAWAGAGFDVVVDHVLLDRTTAADLRAVLDGLTVVHVGLTCDPDVLEAREAERDDRTLGQALLQLRQTADVAVRDVVLDTTLATTEELVEAILDEVAARLEGGGTTRG
jgi:chloramphenicol 3-O phosphotransferase